MKKWYNEEYEWKIEVIGFNKDIDRIKNIEQAQKAAIR